MATATATNTLCAGAARSTASSESLDENSCDYDQLRNLTLMFFLEKLMDRSPRSLHDLSCLFGTKGFTRDMRRIAGGSQAGLRKFLQSYPALFTLDGDQVYITKISSSRNGDGKRDYEREATEYFAKKLEQYGDAEVPVRSLMGHRSQAPPEVRHVSGQRHKEFKDFLLKFPDVFVVKDDYVLLKSVLDRVHSEGHGRESITRVPEEQPIDPYLAKQLINTLEDCVLKMKKNQYSSEAVIPIESLFNYLKANYEDRLWSKMIKNANDLKTMMKMNSKVFHVHQNCVNLTPEREEQLKNEPEKTVRADLLSPPPPPMSNATPSPASCASSPNPSPLHRPPKSSQGSFQQRIRSQIMKVVVENSNNFKSKAMPITTHSNSNSSSSMEVSIIRQAQIVTKSKDAEEILSQVMSSANVVAIDCEGVNLSSSGTVTLIQIAVVLPNSASPKLYLFDVLFNPDMVNQGIKTLLESENIVKVIHDARNDANALYTNFGITLKNVFDTQVGHAVIQQQNTGRPAYKAKYISLNGLCETYGGPPINAKRDQMKQIYRRDQQYWTHRPLTDEMIFHAAHDVYALIPSVYDTMRKSIRSEYLPLLQQLNLEAVLSRIRPDEVKNMKKQRKIDMEVLDLKHRLYATDAKQVVLSNREIRLLRYIDLTDEVRAKIEGFHKVAKKLERLSKKQNGSNDTNGKEKTLSPRSGDSALSGSGSDREDANSSDGHSDESDDDSIDSNQSPSSSNGNHSDVLNGNGIFSPPDSLISTKTSCCNCCHSNYYYSSSTDDKSSSKLLVDAAVQTVSTGDIVVTTVYFEETPHNRSLIYHAS